MRIDNNPGAQLSEQAAAAIYANHPYRIPIIGWEHEIRDITRTDLLDFYKAWYTPNNAVIVISGDVETASVREQVERHFGQIPSRPLPKKAPMERTAAQRGPPRCTLAPARETTVLVTALHRAECRLGGHGASARIGSAQRNIKRWDHGSVLSPIGR